MSDQLRRIAILVTVVAGVVGAAAPGAAQATSITEFALSSTSDPLGIAPGPDGNVWVTNGGPSTHEIDRISPAGTITHFPITGTPPTVSLAPPFDITEGPDGNLWFTADGIPPNAIGKITPAGVITEYVAGVAPGLDSGSAPSNITVGPDGNLWFLDAGSPKAIGRVTPAGVITEFTGPLTSTSNLEELTPGPDGNMWFTDRGNTPAIGRVTPGGTITEFTGGGLNPLTSMPNGITAGSDGNLWFTDEGTDTLGMVTPAGHIPTEFSMGLQSPTVPDAVTLGADGNVWFEDNVFGSRAVGRITPAGTINEFTSGLGAGLMDDITTGPDGNVWVEQSSPGGIARITPSGTISEFTGGLLTNAGSDGDHLIIGPDGNLWFNDRGAKAIGKVSLELPPTATTGPASGATASTATVSASVNPLGAVTTVSFQYGTTPALGSQILATTLSASGDASTVTATLASLPAASTIYYRVSATNGFGTVTGATQTFTTAHGPPPPPPPPPAPAPQSTSASFDGWQITLTTPSLKTCSVRTKTLSVKLTVAAIRSFHASKPRFTSAAFYLDSGVKHTRKQTKRLKNGHRKTVTVTFFTANAVVQRLPATPALHLSALRSGTHTLKVVLSYRQTVIKHHRHTTVTITKTLTVKFKVC